MTRKGIIATVFFLSLTVGAIITEVVFAFDGNKDTHPWTDLIVRYVPWELALAAFGALLLWVPIHFIVRYHKKYKLAAAQLKELRLNHIYRECPDPWGCPVHKDYVFDPERDGPT